MAVINAVSNVKAYQRSVSFTAVCGAGPDTLDFSVIANAIPASANASANDGIKTFLTTAHTNGAGVAAALALKGGLLSAVSDRSGTDVFFTTAADNQLTISGGAATVCIRISLAHTVSA